MRIKLSHFLIIGLITAMLSSWFTATVMSQSPIEKARNRAVKVKQGMWGCSGAILQTNLVVTNAHCVDAAKPVTVGDREGKVIKEDEKLDLALIIVETIVIDRVLLADALAAEDVFSFGFPMDSPNVVFTKGYITVCQFDACFGDFISMAGSSGSGVYDRSGRLVGIVSGYMRDGRLAVFVPTQDLRKFWEVK